MATLRVDTCSEDWEAGTGLDGGTVLAGIWESIPASFAALRAGTSSTINPSNHAEADWFCLVLEGASSGFCGGGGGTGKGSGNNPGGAD
mmetsp:Transcript_18214/g.29614  ORF Transcript_18214/g.29614 Transcript_18214/m.29614 type:complete len:89 (+) Transcript_18214:108-374(+)